MAPPVPGRITVIVVGGAGAGARVVVVVVDGDDAACGLGLGDAEVGSRGDAFGRFAAESSRILIDQPPPTVWISSTSQSSVVVRVKGASVPVPADDVYGRVQVIPMVSW